MSALWLIGTLALELLSLAASPSPAVIHLMHIKARSCHESVICKAYFFNYGKHGKLMRRKIAIRVTTSEFNSELKESRMEGTAISAWLDQWKKVSGKFGNTVLFTIPPCSQPYFRCA